VDEWLEQARTRLAEGVGENPAGYGLSEVDADRLLALARAAAHDSGDRTNAPLVCYLVGLAHARHRDRPLEQLVELAAGNGG